MTATNIPGASHKPTAPTLKARTQALLRRAGLYDRIKTSPLYDLYWIAAGRHVLDARRAEMEFYRKLLRGFRRGDLVFDIGANQGYKTDVFLRIGARVIAVEPDKHSQDVLEKRFLRYRLMKRPVVIDGRAVSDHDGLETMWVDAPGSAKNTLSRKWVDLLRNDTQRFGARLLFRNSQEIPAVSLETLVATHGEPFFIKIDVEGHEATILRSLRRPVPYLSFEVNLPEFAAEGRECIDTLARLNAGGRFNYAVDSRRGMELSRWAEKEQFLCTFHECRAPSIEVFWKDKAP